MEPLGISVVRADESYIYGKYYYYDGPTVYVEITAINCPNSEWRIRGRSSLGDNNVYFEGQGLGTFTFNSSDNMSYILQIQNWGNQWVNTTNMYGENEENSIINVVFDSGGEDSGGGDSGGDDYDENYWNREYFLNVISRKGLDISVYRLSTYNESIAQGSYVGELVNGSKIIDEGNTYYSYRIWPYDTFEVAIKVLDGYELVSSSVTGLNRNGGTYIFYPYNYNGWADVYAVVSGSGSGGGSSSNDSLKEYTFTALGVTAKATYTSGPEVTITILSWDGYNSIPYWRIKGVKSEGDDNTYLPQNNKSSNSFDSYDGYDEGGKNYIFQVCKNGNWNNDGGSASKFNVDFSIDSGGGSGGGSSSATPCGYLIVNQGEGTRLHVQRSWPQDRTCWEDLYTGEPIYLDGEDTFFISVEVLDGYELDYYSFDGELLGYQLENLSYYTEDYTSSGERIVFYQISSYGNATVTTTATPIATANIYTNSGWNRYALNIYDGIQWNRYTPYIYKDSQWKRYR